MPLKATQSIMHAIEFSYWKKLPSVSKLGGTEYYCELAWLWWNDACGESVYSSSKFVGGGGQFYAAHTYVLRLALET